MTKLIVRVLSAPINKMIDIKKKKRNQQLMMSYALKIPHQSH
jgi:hypothetical protein